MAPRRPSTANDAGPSRMSFTSAEALLWGPEMKRQHAYLLTEMRVLQKQHEGYDARIRATQDVAEDAKAATARVRHLEQELDAIKAEDDDKAFEKWASGEMTRLSIFVDTNKNVRQKQIELGAEVSRISETLDRVVRVPADLKSVLRRLDALEHDRREDKHRIESLEGEITRLRSMRPSDISGLVNARTAPKPGKDIGEVSTPTQMLDAELSDATTEPDEEEMLLQRMTELEKVQVPRSPTMDDISSDNVLVASPTKGRSVISARQRLLQRPSIHDSMLPRLMEEQNAQPTPAEKPDTNLRRVSPPPTQIVVRKNRNKEPIPAPESEPEPKPEVVSRDTNNTITNEAPATQIVERKWPRKRKQPHPEPQTQRQTRSQARKNQAKEAEANVVTGVAAVPEPQLVPKIEPISSPRKKLKITPVEQPARSKAKTGGKSQATSRSTKKIQKQHAEEGSSELKPVTPTQQVLKNTNLRAKKATAAPKKKANPAPPPTTPASPAVRKSLVVELRSPRKSAPIDPGDIDESLLNAPARAKRSPRKAAAGPSSPFKVLRNPASPRKK